MLASNRFIGIEQSPHVVEERRAANKTRIDAGFRQAIRFSAAFRAIISVHTAENLAF